MQSGQPQEFNVSASPVVAGPLGSSTPSPGSDTLSQSNVFPNASGILLEGTNTFTSAGRNVYNINPSLSVSFQPELAQDTTFSPSIGTVPPRVTSRNEPGDGEHFSETYARLLLPKRLGWPLWLPNPLSNLPVPYKRRGVDIGDVGIITKDGDFDYFFNICLAADDPINRNSVPENYVPISYLENQEDMRRDLNAWLAGDSVVTNSVIEQSSPGLADSHDIRFAASAPAGALLVMPQGGLRKDLLNTEPFVAYAKKHAPSWYKHINVTRGRRAANGSVYLITGVDKTQLWGTAVYSQSNANACLDPLIFRKANRPTDDSRFKYVWNRSRFATTKYGPAEEVFEDSTEMPHNQCVFLRGFRVALSERLWNSLLGGGVEVAPIQGMSAEALMEKGRNVPFTQSGFSSFFGFSAGGYTSATTRAESAPPPVSVIPEIPEPSMTLHPSDAINQCLLSQNKEADVAITHDDVWCSVLEQDSAELPDPPALLAQIQLGYDAVVADGGICWVSKDRDPSQISPIRRHEHYVSSGASDSDVESSGLEEEFAPVGREDLPLETVFHPLDSTPSPQTVTDSTSMLARHGDKTANRIVHGASSTRISEYPCYFYPSGRCKNGANCRFSHDLLSSNRSSPRSFLSSRSLRPSPASVAAPAPSFLASSTGLNASLNKMSELLTVLSQLDPSLASIEHTSILQQSTLVATQSLQESIQRQRQSLSLALYVAREAVSLDEMGNDPEGTVAAYSRTTALLKSVMEAMKQETNGKRQRNPHREDALQRIQAIHDTYTDRMDTLTLLNDIYQPDSKQMVPPQPSDFHHKSADSQKDSVRDTIQTSKPEIFLGITMGFGSPKIPTDLIPSRTNWPEFISLSDVPSPPFYSQAPSWRHLLKLFANLGGSKLEVVTGSRTLLQKDAKLRTVVQVIRANDDDPKDWRTVIYLTVDHPSSMGVESVNELPYSYSRLKSIPEPLRDGHESSRSKFFTIPDTQSVPLPTLPITFSNLALYLSAALQESRDNKSKNDGDRLVKMLKDCYGEGLEISSTAPSKEPSGPRSGKASGRYNANRVRMGERRSANYELVTPFEPTDF